MTLDDLPTPAAVLDERRLDANIARMQRRIDGLGARLRPHVKTSKCVDVARRQHAAGARGITVSTLKEAEEFHAAGFDDVLYAVGIAPGRLPQARALRERGCALTLIVDSLAAARGVVATGFRHDVMIEVDCDGHRAGVDPESDALLEVGRVLDDGARLRGVMTHAGSSYALDTRAALAALAEQERTRCVRAAERLRGAGLPCPEVSVGSTPTALSAERLDGVTEVRAGVYAFFDLVMHNVGVCRIDEIALSVLATVIGHQPAKGWVLVDAGWMALSRDRGTQEQALDWGYGAVCDVDANPLEDFVVAGANQEHGIVARRDGARAENLERRFPLGSRLRVLPNHACATAAQFDRYAVVAGRAVGAEWPRFSGW